MNTFSIFVTFKCFPGKREAFVTRVKAEGILDEIRSENGCLRYDYYFSEKDENEILLIEEWESKAHQERHIDTPHMHELRTFKGDYVETTTLVEFALK